MYTCGMSMCGIYMCGETMCGASMCDASMCGAVCATHQSEEGEAFFPAQMEIDIESFDLPSSRQKGKLQLCSRAATIGDLSIRHSFLLPVGVYQAWSTVNS